MLFAIQACDSNYWNDATAIKVKRERKKKVIIIKSIERKVERATLFSLFIKKDCVFLSVVRGKKGNQAKVDFGLLAHQFI